VYTNVFVYTVVFVYPTVSVYTIFMNDTLEGASSAVNQKTQQDKRFETVYTKTSLKPS